MKNMKTYVVGVFWQEGGVILNISPKSSLCINIGLVYMHIPNSVNFDQV